MTPDAISTYLQNLQRELSTGHAQEHSYRPALKSLFETLSNFKVINEPKGSAHGRPDFIFLRGETPIAYVEAKDLHVSLEKIEKSEQMARYFGYANLILTNGLEFRFYKNGQRYGDPIGVGLMTEKQIEPQPHKFDLLLRTFQDFLAKPIDTIRSAEHLAQIMGGKARRLRDNIVEIMNPEYRNSKGDIEKIFSIIKSLLIHDLSTEQFADIYAQTLVYGLFVARYEDDTPDNFTRTEARELIPASNPLLQQFFDHISGSNFEKRLAFIVDELCDAFVHSNVHGLVHGLYALTQDDVHDPVIHFYEDFLREYDPALRVERGVFYTPLPVVRYIVRSVDSLLKTHFGLSQGLADRTQVDYETMAQGKKSKRQIDRVQILDPAVGTGTFLNEVIHTVHEQFKNRAGEWPAYVNEHLIPRLHGFELMMASYTIAHLKLSMTLAETGVPKLQKRLRVFLTNSLEEAPPKDDSLLGLIGLQEAITEEALAAAEVKRDQPIMVVLGNPPYSGISQNNGEWITSKIADYLKEPGGKEPLKERKHWLNDDYVKFIRFAESLVEREGQGIVAMVTNHGFLDNPTFRGMRWHLLKTFSHLYILDLHGNSKRKEKSPDGGKDENVFDIQQGVSILLAVRTKGHQGVGAIHRADLYGKREKKYAWLEGHDVNSTDWQEIEKREPLFLFVQKDYGLLSEYEHGLNLADLFPENVTGIVTAKDGLVIDQARDVLLRRIQRFCDSSISDSQLRSEFFPERKAGKYLPGDSRGWKMENARSIIANEDHESRIVPIAYRPFDTQWIYYHPKMVDWGRENMTKHVFGKSNISLIATKVNRQVSLGYFFISRGLVDFHILDSAGDSTSFFPLYVYPDSANLEGQSRGVNLNLQLLEGTFEKLGLTWLPDNSGDGKTTCGPEDVLDYIYAVLHSPTYRARFRGFLNTNFPRVPFTTNAKLFWRLVALGREIRQLHLLEHPGLDNLITRYSVPGDNIVEKVRYDTATKRVYINAAQYVEGVPEDIWSFPIGGYLPLQKWLKDRKGRALSSDDLYHYQRVVVALSETKRLMTEIDEAIEGSGGWPMK